MTNNTGYAGLILRLALGVMFISHGLMKVATGGCSAMKAAVGSIQCFWSPYPSPLRLLATALTR